MNQNIILATIADSLEEFAELYSSIQQNLERARGTYEKTKKLYNASFEINKELKKLLGVSDGGFVKQIAGQYIDYAGITNILTRVYTHYVTRYNEMKNEKKVLEQNIRSLQEKIKNISKENSELENQAVAKTDIAAKYFMLRVKGLKKYDVAQSGLKPVGELVQMDIIKKNISKIEQQEPELVGFFAQIKEEVAPRALPVEKEAIPSIPKPEKVTIFEEEEIEAKKQELENIQKKIKQQQNIEAEQKLDEAMKKAAVAKKKAEDARKKLEEATAAKKLEEISAAKKLQEEATAKKLQEEAAAKKLQEEAAAKKLEEATAATAKKLQEETAAKKLQEEAVAKKLEEKAAAKKLEEKAAAKKLEEEAAAKKLEEEAAAKKLEEEAAAKKLEEEAAAKKLEEEAAAKKLQEEAAAAKKLEEESAAKKLEKEAVAKKLEKEVAAKKLEAAAKKKAEIEAKFSKISVQDILEKYDAYNILMDYGRYNLYTSFDLENMIELIRNKGVKVDQPDVNSIKNSWISIFKKLSAADFIADPKTGNQILLVSSVSEAIAHIIKNIAETFKDDNKDQNKLIEDTIKLALLNNDTTIFMIRNKHNGATIDYKFNSAAINAKSFLSGLMYNTPLLSYLVPYDRMNGEKKELIKIAGAGIAFYRKIKSVMQDFITTYGITIIPKHLNEFVKFFLFQYFDPFIFKQYYLNPEIQDIFAKEGFDLKDGLNLDDATYAGDVRTHLYVMVDKVQKNIYDGSWAHTKLNARHLGTILKTDSIYSPNFKDALLDFVHYMPTSFYNYLYIQLYTRIKMAVFEIIKIYYHKYINDMPTLEKKLNELDKNIEIGYERIRLLERWHYDQYNYFKKTQALNDALTEYVNLIGYTFMNKYLYKTQKQIEEDLVYAYNAKIKSDKKIGVKSESYDIYKKPYLDEYNKYLDKSKALQFGIWNAPRVPIELTVYRMLDDNEKKYSNFKVGDITKLLRFQSTTIRKNPIYGVFGPDPTSKYTDLCCMYIITIPVGTPVLDVDYLAITQVFKSKYTSEQEILLPHGLCYKITKIDTLDMNHETKTRAHKYTYGRKIPKNYKDKKMTVIHMTVIIPKDMPPAEPPKIEPIVPEPCK